MSHQCGHGSLQDSFFSSCVVSKNLVQVTPACVTLTAIHRETGMVHPSSNPGSRDHAHANASFGKSVTYGILPTIFDRMKVHTAPTSIALIVSPLASLMVDQKARFSSICKLAAFVTDDWLQY